MFLFPMVVLDHLIIKTQKFQRIICDIVLIFLIKTAVFSCKKLLDERILPTSLSVCFFHSISSSILILHVDLPFLSVLRRPLIAIPSNIHLISSAFHTAGK